VRAFTVAENVHLGWSETPRLVSAAKIEAHTAALAKTFGLSVRPDARIDELSAGEQQRMEILRVLARQARILILDEPTAVLTPAEAQALFDALRAFREAGNSVIFISHKLEEVLEISDRVTVLRGGRKIATENRTDCTTKSLARMMVGRDIDFGGVRREMAADAHFPQRPVLELVGVSATDDRGRLGLVDVNLTLRAGEILGIAGIAGNGQRELSEVLTGVRPISGGSIRIEGKTANDCSPSTFIGVGVGHIPEDRLKSGLAPSLSISDNAIFRAYGAPPISSGTWFRPAAAEALAQEIVGEASVQVPSVRMPIRNLSGGNQQRLLARREMRVARLAIIAAYPNRGLDVGAADTVSRYLIDLRNRGVGVLLISEELSELFQLSDRIAVMFKGRIMGIFDARDADLETVGLLMGGHAASSSEAA
jgi:simple sugar transport system ATP-binding protein